MAGLGITLLAWFSSWGWPAWPALTMLDLAFPKGGFGTLSFGARSAVVVVLMFVNVAFWGGAVWLLIYAASFRARSRRPS